VKGVPTRTGMRHRGQRCNLIVITIQETDGDLDAMKLVLPRKVDSPLGVLKIEGFEWVGAPVA
jgi:hypothetical protein